LGACRSLGPSRTRGTTGALGTAGSLGTVSVPAAVLAAVWPVLAITVVAATGASSAAGTGTGGTAAGTGAGTARGTAARAGTGTGPGTAAGVGPGATAGPAASAGGRSATPRGLATAVVPVFAAPLGHGATFPRDCEGGQPWSLVGCPLRTPLFSTHKKARRLPGPLLGSSLLGCARRRPTLPRGPPRSTIGAEGLNFRVRNGTGCFPFAMAAVTLWKCQPGLLLVLVVFPEPHSGRESRSPDPLGGSGKKYGAKPLGLLVPVSSARCRASTSGLSTQSSSWGPYLVDPERDLILRRASRLDAFSGYPFRT
jgi:hypothetical protein